MVARQQESWQEIKRRPTRVIRVGSVRVGGDAPISVQSMTNTPTEDAVATLAQIGRLKAVGADMVRVSCPTEESTAALAAIVRGAGLPIVADIHFHYKRAIEAARAGAACLRINPGNIGAAHKVSEVVAAAKDNGCSIRIGVNGGSLERHVLEKYGRPCPEAMVESAIQHARLLDERDFSAYKISVKASDVFLTIAAYEALSRRTDAPLHLGVTEAGSARVGGVKSALGIGSLLRAGIGDTIRVSLAADPVEEIAVGFDILASLGLRHRGVKVIACPSCARQGFDVIKTVKILEERLGHVREPVTLSIIGCVVNGPGEAASADVGFTGGGKGAGMMYLSGSAAHKIANTAMIDEIVARVEEHARSMRPLTEDRAPPENAGAMDMVPTRA